MEAIDKKFLTRIGILGALMSLGLFLLISLDRRTKLVFCNVGQGDGAYIRVEGKVDILVDAGPDRSILSCLGRHMPFYDRRIELAILSHPQKDHFGGYQYILDRYKVQNFIVSSDIEPSQTYTKLRQKLQTKSILVRKLYKGDIINVLSASMVFLWPSKGWEGSFDKALDPNLLSSVFVFSHGSSKILFTGDATPDVLNRLPGQDIPKTDILKIPHHGSKNGLTEKFISLADPRISVISVGKNNSYGHPSSSVMDILKAKQTRIRRTDLEGDVVFYIN